MDDENGDILLIIY